MAVEVSVREICGELEITALEPGSGSISFQTPEISRPGLQFTGFYEKFSPKRVQLIGNAEMYYLYSLTPEQLADRMERFMGLHVPCIVCARGNKPPEILLEKARHYACRYSLQTVPPTGWATRYPASYRKSWHGAYCSMENSWIYTEPVF